TGESSVPLVPTQPRCRRTLHSLDQANTARIGRGHPCWRYTNESTPARGRDARTAVTTMETSAMADTWDTPLTPVDQPSWGLSPQSRGIPFRANPPPFHRPPPPVPPHTHLPVPSPALGLPFRCTAFPAHSAASPLARESQVFSPGSACRESEPTLLYRH